MSLNENISYQEGAVAAMTEASKNDWFDGYEWIFRMNPDVIIQNDTWMLEIVKNDADASLLYIDCAISSPDPKPICPETVNLIHTDFFGLKLGAIPKGHLEKSNAKNAEFGFTKKMASIIDNRQHRHIPGAYPKVHHFCRVNGNPDGPVFHYHSYNVTLPNINNWTCPAKFFN